MLNTTKLIQLSAEDIIALIKEKSVHREGIVISSTVSFLSILSMLDDEMVKRLSHARSKPA